MTLITISALVALVLILCVVVLAEINGYDEPDAQHWIDELRNVDAWNENLTRRN